MLVLYENVFWVRHKLALRQTLLDHDKQTRDLSLLSPTIAVSLDELAKFCFFSDLLLLSYLCFNFLKKV